MRKLLILLITSLAFMQDYSLAFEANTDNRVILPKLFTGVSNEFTFSATILSFSEQSFQDGIVCHNAYNNDVVLEFGSSNQIRGQIYSPYKIVEGEYYNLNSFHDILITYNGTNFELYQDGEKIASGENSNFGSIDWDDGYESTSLGWRWTNGGTSSFDGLIKEATIWDSYFSEEEVQNFGDIINEGLNEGLLAHYMFSSGQGNILYDYSGNENHGTIHGAKWITNGNKYVSTDGADETGNGSEDYPFSSIQEAIDYSMDGDSIFVLSGTYYENINFNGKNIALIGEGRETTIIESSSSDNCISVNINSPNTEISVVSGFTVIPGQDCKGVVAINSNAIISNNIFISNADNPAAVYFSASEGIISQNIVKGFDDFGIVVDGNSDTNLCNSPLIHQNLIYDNSIGLGVEGGGEPIIKNNTIVQNETGFRWNNGCNYEFTNNILWNNETNIIDGGNSEISFNYNLIGDNSFGDTNFSTDPQFVDSDNGDFTLQPSSPCIDAGDPNSELDPDGTIVDMGAYPFFQIPGCTDELACNYNSEANFDDGSCDYSCYENGNYSLSFDGIDDYVAGPNISTLHGATATYTISLWVKLLENSGNQLLWTYDGSDVGEPDDIYMYWNGSHIRYATGCPAHIDTCPELSSNITDLGDNQWHHIVYVKTPTQVLLYEDGILKNTENRQGGDFSDAYTFRLADNMNISHWNGLIDELTIWSTSLTQSEIQSYMTTSPTGSETGLIGYWRFKAGSGNILYDYSGNQNHGAINGASWIENIYGCADELACNYNPDSNIDDDTCNYSCHDNGDYSLSFDGIDDYIDIGNQSDFDIQDAITISVSVKPDDLQTTSIIDKMSQSGIGYRLALRAGDYDVEETGVVWSSFGPTEFITSDINSYIPGEYIEVTGVWKNNSYFKLFLDGILVSESPTNQSYDINHSLEFGRLSYDNEITEHLKGDIRRVAFWDIELTESEINLISNLDEIPNENNLLGNWKMNSEDGNIVYDYSGNQNHGTIHGASWVENIYGCTDQFACNYNSEADFDDGSCSYHSGAFYISADGNNDNCGTEEYSFSSIQYAIDFASDGDSIFVSEGTYYENINFNGKNISVIGEDSETTIIDGGQWGAVLTFENNETVEALFSNFTIQNGYKTQYDFLWPYNYGAGVFCQNASPTISNIIIKNNSTLGSSPEFGGGGAGMFIYMNSSPFLENLYIYNNSGIHGGGMLIHGNSHPIMNSSIIDSNFVLGDGGGIHIMENSSLTIHESMIVNNSSDLDGGGLFIEGSTNINIIDSEISNNTATLRGGGIHASNNSSVSIYNSEISNNQAINDVAGGIEFNQSSGIIDNCIIDGNIANNTGGIALIDSHVDIYHSLISNNTSEQYSAAALQYNVSSSGNLYNVTIANNYSIIDTPVIALSANSEISQIQNSIIYNNNAENIFQNQDDESQDVNINITFSNIEDGWEGESNIDADPQFTDPDNGDFTLQITSPCIDTGDHNSELDPDGTRADMGAYPFDQIETPIIRGCINSESCNYNSEANVDDGSCWDAGYNCGDLAVLYQFILNSQDSNNPLPLDLPPYDLGDQTWQEGRLIDFCRQWGSCGTDHFLSGQIPDNIGNWDALIDLHIGYNELYGEIPESFGDMISLEDVNIAANSFTGTLPETIGNLDNLINLVIYENEFNGSIPDGFCDMSSLEYIASYDNDFTSLPSCIGNLSNMINMDFRWNNISGSLPEDIDGMQSLRYLNMPSNNLTGYIPDSITNIPYLEMINLAYNNISGAIPDDLATLEYLNIFLVNNNLISGYLPDDICSSNIYFEDGGFNVSNNNLCAPYPIPDCIDDFGGQNSYGCEFEYKIPLHSNANLISFMSLPTDNYIGTVLESLGDNVKKVVGQGMASQYSPSLEQWLGSLTTFESEQGYWVDVFEPDTIVINSPDYPGGLSPNYVLSPGANLISFPFVGPCLIAEAIPDDVEPYITGIVTEGMAASQNPALGWVGSLNYLQGSAGYWFIVTEQIEFEFIDCNLMQIDNNSDSIRDQIKLVKPYMESVDPSLKSKNR